MRHRQYDEFSDDAMGRSQLLRQKETLRTFEQQLLMVGFAKRMSHPILVIPRGDRRDEIVEEATHQAMVNATTPHKAHPFTR